MAEEAGGGDGLGEDDADGDEDGAGAGSEGNGDFDAGAFFILIAAAETEAAFGEIFADGDFFLETAAADAGEDASFDAGAIAARNEAFFDGRAAGRASFRDRGFRIGIRSRWKANRIGGKRARCTCGLRKISTGAR